MSKRDYRMVAAVLRQCAEDCESTGDSAVIQYVSLKLATAFRENDERFDPRDFLVEARTVAPEYKRIGGTYGSFKDKD